MVTRAYLNNPEETRLAKIADGDTFWHRMGDVGYLDQDQRLWFCGRRAHRVVTEQRTLFSVPCEAIINEHPDVYRSALVGINDGNQDNGIKVPVIVVEPKKEPENKEKMLLEEVRERAAHSELTGEIEHFLVHKNFPVDIRHNAKIFREKLALWAQQKIFTRSIKKALVTGGGGFVGKAIVTRLLRTGVETTVVGRHRYPEIEQLGGQMYRR